MCYNIRRLVLQEEDFGDRFKTKGFTKNLSADQEGDTPIS